MKKTAKKQDKNKTTSAVLEKTPATEAIVKSKKTNKKDVKPSTASVTAAAPAVESVTKNESSEVKKINSKFNLTGPVKRSDNALAFSQNDLHILEMFQMRVKLAQSEYKESALAVEKFALEIQNKLKEARDAQAKLQEAYNAKVSQISSLYGEIAELYNIDMSKISYDPVTGKIHKVS